MVRVRTTSALLSGLTVQVAAVSTPTAAPVITATRPRRGSTASGHGAPRLIADAVATARNAGAASTCPAT